MDKITCFFSLTNFKKNLIIIEKDGQVIQESCFNNELLNKIKTKVNEYKISNINFVCNETESQALDLLNKYKTMLQKNSEFSNLNISISKR